MPLDAALIAEWSRRHDGYDVTSSRLVMHWLTMVHRLSQPLVRIGVGADLVSAAGVASAVAAVVAPPVVAGSLVAWSAVLDGVDGAVALHREHSRRGVVVDRVADRTCDVLFAVAMHRHGCPRRLAATSGIAAVAFELFRDVRRRARRGIGRVTVGDRPMRVALVAVGLPVAPTAAAVAVTAASIVGAVQLARVDAVTPGRPALR